MNNSPSADKTEVDLFYLHMYLKSAAHCNCKSFNIPNSDCSTLIAKFNQIVYIRKNHSPVFLCHILLNSSGLSECFFN